ncbi:MAG TPA: cytochrome P450 [Candidatus Bathyarchaeia archaeon]|jgi:cytochrome P450|nr:cytochrome P450 [Candidatus Bathyarchaeia archaeon]
MWFRRDKFPPGPYTGLKGWSFRALKQSPLEMFTELARHGDIVGVRVVNFKNIFINHPSLIEEVLVGHPRRYYKGRVLRANRHVFGEGLLTSEGDFWLRQRRLVQPAFHRARIAAYAGTMVEYAQRLMENWSAGEERDVHQEMMKLTLQIVAKTLFNADVTRDARDVGKSLELLLELGADFRRTLFVPHWVPTFTNLRIKREIAFIESILYRIINERRVSGRDTGDLLSMLLHAQDEDGSRMTDKQLRDETITLFLAGHETTASSLSWTWWLLAQNPAVEAKLHSELDEVLDGRAPSMDDLARLPYTANVITESMRLYPPAWGLARIAVEDHELGGYPVRKGMGVAMAQWVVHRDTRWYDTPEEFRPERWEGDFGKRIPRFAYFPFGGGPRQCIGNSFAVMEATLILATIAQKYRLCLVPDHPVVPLASITLRPRYGVRVVLESRQRRFAETLATESQPASQVISAD